MGSKISGAAEASLGESVVLVSPEEGYRIWAEKYDEGPNPLIALEDRVVREAPGLTADLDNRVAIDVATGTGRWLKYALQCGAEAFGVDSSADMLTVAARDNNLAGRLIRGDMRLLPFRTDAARIAMCSLALGYIDSPAPALSELGRVASRVIVSDLHPLAAAAGWTRSFRSAGVTYRITQFLHAPQELNLAMQAMGFRRDWYREACFGPPEEAIFKAAGKGEAFLPLARIPAVFAASWTR